MPNRWQPSLGAWCDQDRVHFRIWAPGVRHLTLLLDSGQRHALERADAGFWRLSLPSCRAGVTYRYLVDGRGPFPDPASRFQPQGVHGPSEVIDSRAFSWTDAGWQGIAAADLIIYELHVGTFTPEGTFEALRGRLPYLKELGVTCVELMPVADFPGQRNWGYDGVCPFAPARCYGRPDDLRRLVDDAHRLGLAVFLDVVYNHLGPDGNYTGVYSPHYVTARHRTPWGDALNFDGPHSEHVRAFFRENALHWLDEYHLDGLRLDATHAIHDDSATHFLAELAAEVKDAFPERQVHLIAEDHRNFAHMVKPLHQNGWGLDGIWADDFHHEVRRLLAGDREGYYRDYRGTTTDLATILNQGWLYTGQHSEHLDEPRGSDPAGLSPAAFVLCLQNHDQVGNRAFGERLHHQLDEAVYRAASVLLLCAAQTPLLFMGQEWACSAPFRFFTDHTPELGRLVTEGRRREFRHFSAFADPKSREQIPDPQATSTFEVCRLNWEEQPREPHARTLALYREVLRLRRTEPALRGRARAWAAGENALVLERRAEDGSGLAIVCQLRGGGQVPTPAHSEIVLATDRAGVACAKAAVSFTGPGAVVLRC